MFGELAKTDSKTCEDLMIVVYTHGFGVTAECEETPSLSRMVTWARAKRRTSGWRWKHDTCLGLYMRRRKGRTRLDRSILDLFDHRSSEKFGVAWPPRGNVAIVGIYVHEWPMLHQRGLRQKVV